MTDAQTTEKDEQSTGEPARVVRDSTFVRMFADNVFLQDLGRDLDLCLIQFGPRLTHFSPTDTEISVEASESVTEAGRVRLAWPIAVSIAMNILSRGIESGLVKGDKVVESLQEASANRTDEDVRGEKVESDAS